MYARQMLGSAPSPTQMRDQLIARGYITMAGDVIDVHGLYTYATAQGWTNADIDAAMYTTDRFRLAPPPPPPPPPPPSVALDPRLTSWGNDTSPVTAVDPVTFAPVPPPPAPAAPSPVVVSTITPAPTPSPQRSAASAAPSPMTSPATGPITGPGGGVMTNGVEMFYSQAPMQTPEMSVPETSDTSGGVYTMQSARQSSAGESEGDNKMLLLGAAALLVALALRKR